MDNKNSIDRFCGFFRREIASINAGNLSGDTELCKRLLLCCLLDTLAKTAFPGEGEVGKRFTRLIREHGNWPNSTKVSLTHLRKLLSLIDPRNEQMFLEIRRFAESKNVHSAMHGFPLDEDPDFSEVCSLWPREKGKPIKVLKKFWAESIRHDYLFYTFRNNLVHEFKAPKISGYFAPSAQPYYLPGRHDLYYPTDFLAALAQNVISSVEAYLRSSNTDPYNAFQYGPFLINELNIHFH